ncbi:hypothetical protein CMQ_1991 [Grosmannia clavigera kw1407]|uniref:Uncharacterized protein n=1 Tax=Grosmannia clavigera (strain kw1407 / UAMH 11150) TaxID=655863 RepID=F0XMZ1_GROCL|nr:uncharacterized protein CMQ_1991 [Grosmannia clavigera kw1407]EFX00910.1 hypothetical protein CMQ_1991 [Grosmannia clavigera kw1407]
MATSPASRSKATHNPLAPSTASAQANAALSNSIKHHRRPMVSQPDADRAAMPNGARWHTQRVWRERWSDGGESALAFGEDSEGNDCVQAQKGKPDSGPPSEAAIRPHAFATVETLLKCPYLMVLAGFDRKQRRRVLIARDHAARCALVDGTRGQKGLLISPTTVRGAQEPGARIGRRMGEIQMEDRKATGGTLPLTYADWRLVHQITHTPPKAGWQQMQRRSQERPRSDIRTAWVDKEDCGGQTQQMKLHRGEAMDRPPHEKSCSVRETAGVSSEAPLGRAYAADAVYCKGHRENERTVARLYVSLTLLSTPFLIACFTPGCHRRGKDGHDVCSGASGPNLRRLSPASSRKGGDAIDVAPLLLSGLAGLAICVRRRLPAGLSSRVPGLPRVSKEGGHDRRSVVRDKEAEHRPKVANGRPDSSAENGWKESDKVVGEAFGTCCPACLWVPIRHPGPGQLEMNTPPQHRPFGCSVGSLAFLFLFGLCKIRQVKVQKTRRSGRPLLPRNILIGRHRPDEPSLLLQPPS